MNPPDHPLAVLCEALVRITIHHAHVLFDEDPQSGSLITFHTDLDCALRHTPTGPVIESAYLEALSRQIREAISLPWGHGTQRSRQKAFVRAVISELKPFVRGNKKLARSAGAMLALLIDDSEQMPRLTKRLKR